MPDFWISMGAPRRPPFGRGQEMEFNSSQRCDGGWLAFGKRVCLRDFQPTDWKEVHLYASDPAVVKYMSWGPNTEAETRSFVASAVAEINNRPRRRYDLAISLLESGAVVGGCGIYIRSGREFEAEIGYCLRKAFWGQGLATETAVLLRDFCFSVLEAHRVIATCDPDNKASARVLEKIGMRREGLMRGHMLRSGCWCDSFLYAMLAEDLGANYAGERVPTPAETAKRSLE